VSTSGYSAASTTSGVDEVSSFEDAGAPQRSVFALARYSTIASLDRSGRKRSAAAEDQVVASLPRGLVRTTSGLRVRVDVGPAFTAKGELAFYADGERVHAERFEPESVTNEYALPAAVAEAAAAGREIRWGFYPEDGAAPIAALAGALEKQDPLLIATLRANLLLKHGLFHAAYLELANGPPSEPTCAVLKVALRGMELEGTPLWSDVLERADQLPRGD